MLYPFSQLRLEEEFAEIRPQLQFLDIGASRGFISASFANHIPRGIVVVATDISKDILQHAAKDHAKQVGWKNIQFQIADVYKLPFPDQSFDVVHVSQALVHLSDPVTALKEMFRVCAPGGLVAAREAEPRSFCSFPDLHPLRLFSPHSGVYGQYTSVPSFLRTANQYREVRYRFNISALQSIKHSVVHAKNGTERRNETQSFCKKIVNDTVNAWDEWIKNDYGYIVVITGELMISKHF